MQIIGYLEAYVSHVLIGWAYCPLEPTRRLLLRVDVNGEPIAAGLANLDRQDVAAAGHGDGRCGFRIAVQLPAGASMRIVDSQSGQVIFTEENVAATADGVADEDRPGESSVNSGISLARGHVDTVSGSRIVGWCWHPMDPSRHVQIAALVDGAVVARGTADEVRGDLLNAGIGEGDHAFSLNMPYWMLDGVPREVHVQVDDGSPLDGSPIKFVGLAEGGRPLLDRLIAAVPPDNEVAKRAADLLQCYLSHQEMIAPKSVGFGYYAEWLRALAAGGDDDIRLPVRDDLAEAALKVVDANGDSIIIVIDEGTVPRSGAIVRALRAMQRMDADILYGDAAAEVDGAPLPWFRPDWSYDLCLAQDYTRGLTLIRESILTGLPGCQTLAGIRNAALLSGRARIRHLPEVLCELVRPPAQTMTMDVSRVVAAHVHQRTRDGARISLFDGVQGLRRVDWPLPADPPLISLIIPTRDRLSLLRRAVDSIIERTRYGRFEIIIIDNQSVEPETLAWLADGASRGRFKVLRYDAPFNFSDMNNKAAATAAGDILGFINNDVELISGDWLEIAVAHLSRPEVGAVGARLRFPNGMIQHAGVVVGTGGLAENAFQQVKVGDTGYFNRSNVAGNYSAVTAACLFCRKQEFLDLGGFDAANLPVAFNDVDFCLRLRERDRQIVWTPHIELYHYESVSRGRDSTPEKQARALKEELYMRRRWAERTLQDPFYNPNLNLDGAPFTGLALPPRHNWGELG